jgi:hypothetical protein
MKIWKTKTKWKEKGQFQVAMFHVTMPRPDNFEMVKINQAITTHYISDDNISLSSVLYPGNSIIYEYIKASYGRDN